MKNKIRAWTITLIVCFVIFLITLAKGICYAVILANPSMFQGDDILSITGIEGAYIWSHFPADFIDYMNFRMTGWWILCGIFGILSICLLIRIIYLCYKNHWHRIFNKN